MNKNVVTDIYLTSTFRHEWNRQFNLVIGEKLEAQGMACYLAHRDTDQTASPDVVFQQDLAGMDQSKIILAIAENESPNWGAELGYAYARRIPIIALAQQDHPIPLICNGMIQKVLRVPDLNMIDAYMSELLETIKEAIQSLQV